MSEPGHQDDSWLSTSLMVAAAFTLSRAVQINSGMLNGRAIVWLGMGLGFCTVAVAAGRLRAGGGRWGEIVVRSALLVAVWLQLLQLWFRQPALTAFPEATLFKFHVALAAAGVVAGLGVARVPGLQRLWFPAVLCIFAAIGFWIVSSSPPSPVDVFMFQRDAATALIMAEILMKSASPTYTVPTRPFTTRG